MSGLKKVNIEVMGKVQGVGYRFFTEELAMKLAIYGYVKNLPNKNVYIEAEGEKAKLELFINNLRVGTPLSKVIDVKVEWKNYEGNLSDFSIRY